MGGQKKNALQQYRLQGAFFENEVQDQSPKITILRVAECVGVSRL